jgi:hypothetical protein
MAKFPRSTWRHPPDEADSPGTYYVFEATDLDRLAGMIEFARRVTP